MTRPIRVLELRSVRGTGGGPEKTILLGTSRTDPRRFAITVCYLRDARDRVFGIDRKAAPLNLDYVEIRERHSFDLAIWRQLRALVRDRGIDIVHAHEYKTNLLALLVARAERVIPLSTVHGWTGHALRERWLYYPADKRLLARFPRLVAVSTNIRDELIRAGAHPERITTVLNGIDHRTFQRDPQLRAGARAAFGIAPDELVVGSVGRLEPQKRFDLLIEAVAALRRSHRVRLLVAGDGTLRSELDALAARRLPGACSLVGHCTDVAKVFHALDVFVQSSDYEGTPNAVLEAMAFGVPVVATDAGGTAELVIDGADGLIVPPGDVGALRHAVERILEDPAIAARYAAAARRRVENELSFDTRMAKLEAVYEQLIRERRPDGSAGAATFGSLHADARASGSPGKWRGGVRGGDPAGWA